MKTEFYVHGTSELIDLSKESEPLVNWNKIYDAKYPESIIYYEIYTRQDYFKSDCTILPGDVVVDCGGNIGVFSSIAIDMGAARVLSFEPFIDNYRINKKNNPNVEVFNNAVSNKSDENLELLFAPGGNGGHTIVKTEFDRDPGHFEHKNLFVRTITLDDIISRNFIDHIDFLKIDTEGAELSILEGLSDENLDKIRCISLEYHHYIFNYDDNVYVNFQNRFLRRGFNVFTWLLDNDTRMTYICKGDVFIDNPNHTR